MANKVSKIIDENNQLRQQLNDQNKEYYEKLLIYVRSAGFFYDDNEVESSLLEILKDIIDAQKDYKNAEEYLGKNPSEVADELIANYTKISLFERVKFIGLLFGISVIWTLITQFSSSNHEINLMPFILNGVFMIALTAGMMWFVHQTTYRKLFDNKKIEYTVAGIFGVVVIAIFAGILFITPSFMSFSINNGGIVFVNVIVIVACLVGIYFLPDTYEQILIAAMPVILIITLLNIIKTFGLPYYVIKQVSTIAIILLILGIFWFGAVFWHSTQQDNKK